VAVAAPIDAARAAVPPAEPFPDTVGILVGGPPGGRLDRWAAAIEAAFIRILPPDTQLRERLAGGADGVTAANQFGARVAPDGHTVLLLPGEAPLAWLIGDPRAQFDAAGWLPVMAGITSGVLVSRVPPGKLRPGSRLSVAASTPGGPEMAALLGLDLMGVEPVPTFGLSTPARSLQALTAHAVDAVFVGGPNAMALAGAAAAAQAAPLFTLGEPTQDGLRRDPSLPQVPTGLELAVALRGVPPAGALAGAWRSAAAATEIEFALVLPPLTPAALVAQWRSVGIQAAEALQPRASGVRLLGATEANAATAAFGPEPAAVLELRRWLAARFNWTPS
jgi:hypothetical protein